jgi:AcrR family transcriptional regulator
VGVQKTALYYYFPSKAALYLAVFARMLEDFDRCLSTAVSLDVPYRDRLDRLVDDLNDLLAEKRNYSQILIRIFVDHAGVDLSDLGPALRGVIERLLRFYHGGVEAGAFRKLSARHFFMSLLGMTVFHYAAQNFSAPVLGVDDIFTRGAVAWRRDEVRRMLTRGVLRGGGPEPES